MKVAIFTTEYDTCSSMTLVPEAIGDWLEVTDREYKALQAWLAYTRRNAILVTQTPPDDVIETVAQCLAKAIEYDESLKEKRAAAAAKRQVADAKRKAREEKRKLEAMEKERKLFEDLKKKYEDSLDAQN